MKNIKTISIMIKIRISQLIAKNSTQTKNLKPNQTLFHRIYLNLTSWKSDKSDIFMEYIKIWYHFSLVSKYENILMTFITGIFPFYLQRRAQTKINIKQDMCKSNLTVFFLIYLFTLKWVIEVIKGKMSLA